MYIIGVDLGASKINAALIYKGRILKKVKSYTQSRKGTSKIIENLIQTIKKVWDRKVKKIGIGVAGIVDFKKGILKESPNFSSSFKNIPLKKILEKNFKVLVKVENDADVFTLGETILGQGKNYNIVLGVTLGTGIGGGLVINQKIYHGLSYSSLEIGHHTIVSDSEIKCSCGKKGHFEALASGSALVNFYKNLTGQKKDTFEIEKLALRNNKKALLAFKETSYYLALGLANIITILNPQIVILGGGMSRVKILTKPALQLLPKMLPYKSLSKTKIKISRDYEKMALLGASII